MVIVTSSSWPNTQQCHRSRVGFIWGCIKIDGYRCPPSFPPQRLPVSGYPAALPQMVAMDKDCSVLHDDRDPGIAVVDDRSKVQSPHMFRLLLLAAPSVPSAYVDSISSILGTEQTHWPASCCSPGVNHTDVMLFENPEVLLGTPDTVCSIGGNPEVPPLLKPLHRGHTIPFNASLMLTFCL